VADRSLEQWLKSILSVDECEFELPRLALALSGGGPKAGITTAGVVQALDSRDSSYGVSGLLQSMTYMSALSGGSLTLSGQMVNNFAKISELKASLYDTNYQNPFLLALQNTAQIVSYTLASDESDHC
jgi:lysophospholipase